MSPWWRKFVLTSHVTVSVGWLGSVATFLVLAAVGLAGGDDGLARATYQVMEPIGWYVIVPLSIASLVTGVVQALGSPWGLLRHYWVIFKLLINLLATVVLFVHMKPIAYLADMAAAHGMSGGAGRVQVQILVDSAAAVLVLVIATVLSVYKPRGRTGFRAGWFSRRREQPA
ncbi:MAG: hypothetical protein HOY78_06390 [Saccharothrix sp.]|nr:hypothetical protein [Saccharothrix sp.]